MMRGFRTLLLPAAAMALSGLAAAQPASDNANLNLAPDEIQTSLVKILRTSNKAQTNRYVPKVYNFEHVNPYAVIRFVRRVMEIEESVWFAFANPDQKSGKVLVSVPEYQIEGLDGLMALIDREGLTSSAGAKRILYRLRHRDAFDAGVQAVCAQEGTPTAVLLPDGQINSWLVEDSPSGIARIADATINKYDQPTPQMEAHIKVYEIDLNDDGQIGLDYVSWKNGPGRNLAAFGAFAQKEKISTLDEPSALLYHSGKNTHQLPGRTFESTGRNGAYFYDLPSAYFDFLVTKGQARILTNSKQTVLDRATALLEIGERIRYYQVHHDPDLRGGSRILPLDPYGDLEALVDTNVAGETTDLLGVRLADHPDNRTVVPTTRERALGEVATGFFIQLTPTINQKGCAIRFFMSYVNHTGYADDGTPTVASRSLDQMFKIPHDGREITLGGMVRKRRIDSANKIPWLGDLPVLGYLFGGESRLDQKTMVLTTFAARKIEFGASNVTDEDVATQEYVEGLREQRTMDNDPGFLGR